MVSVTIGAGSNLDAGPPRVLFSTQGFLASDVRAQYDVSADDQRFPMLRIMEGGDLELVRADNLLDGVPGPRGG